MREIICSVGEMSVLADAARRSSRPRLGLRAFTLALSVVMIVASFASAQDYRMERIASGLNQPIYLSQAPGDPDNILYYATRIDAGVAPGTGGGFGSINPMGGIFRYDTNTRTSTEIMSLAHRTLVGDLGLVGFSFSPDFNTPGAPGYQKLYVSSSQRNPGFSPIDTVEEYVVNGPGGTVPVNGMGQPIVNREILKYTHVNTDQNHTVNWIGFDPRADLLPVGSPERNYLYISAGDGALGVNAQGRPEQKGNDVRGKVLRVDVDAAHPDAYPAGDTAALTRNFAIPPTNPIPLWNAAHPGNQQLVGTTLNYTTNPMTVSYSPAAPEIYMTGIRNTFRMSLDKLTGDIYGGDVGENSREEINFLKADTYDGSQPPIDFGYAQREGTRPTGAGGASGVTGSTGATTLQWNLSGGSSVIVDSANPIREGNHASINTPDEVRNTGRSSYMGGYVYRGPIAELQGKYFYTDYIHGNIFSLDFDRDTPLASYSGTNFNQDGTGVAALGTRETVLTPDVNSLWQTLAFDPTDPSYTPAIGGTFGVSRVVSFGEDNDGNLYIIDFGGNRGNPAFDGDYPSAGQGEIFRLVPTLAISVTINRETGALTFANETGAAVDIRGYSVTSGSGAINPAELTPVTGRLDAMPNGDGSIDPNNFWAITSAPGDLEQFSEESTGSETTLSIGEQFTLSPEDGWIQSIYEDLQLKVILANGSESIAQVEYVGNSDVPFASSDLNFNGDIDPGDWDIFKANHGHIPGGLSLAQAYGLGDLDGDGDNDFADFRIFQSDYIIANGAAAFAALGSVPEPGSVVLATMALSALTFSRRRRRRADRGFERGCVVRCLVLKKKWVATFAAMIVCGLMVVDAHAAIVRQYTFNDGTASDSIGNADGTLFGNADITDGVLDLPGGGGDYVGLPGATIGINGFTDATFEAWFQWEGGGGWQRVFDFGAIAGASGTDYIFYSPNGGGNSHRAAIRDASLTEDIANGGSAVSQNVMHHVAVVVDDSPGADTIALYLDGAFVDSDALAYSFSQLSNANAFLGRSLFSGDSYLNGKIDEFRIYNTALTAQNIADNFAAGPVPIDLLEIEVNTFTGQVAIKNSAAAPVSIDYYRITSPGDALSPGTWNSLDDQNVDSIGIDTGESWDEAGGPDAGEVAELYIYGASTLGEDDTRSLGQLFDTSVFGKRVDGDLVFQYANQGGGLITGDVTYITPPPLFGDYNDDGFVNAADYTVYRNRKAGIGGTTLVNDAGAVGVTIDDYNTWKANYGDSLGFGSGASLQSQNVPEPGSAILLAVGALASAISMNRAKRRFKLSA